MTGAEMRLDALEEEAEEEIFPGFAFAQGGVCGGCEGGGVSLGAEQVGAGVAGEGVGHGQAVEGGEIVGGGRGR